MERNFARNVKDNNVHGKAQVKLCGAVTDETKNDIIKYGGFSPAQWVLGKAPRGVGHLLDEDEHAQLGTLERLHDPAGEFSLQQTYRLSGRKAFVKEDCGKSVLLEHCSERLRLYQAIMLLVT